MEQFITDTMKPAYYRYSDGTLLDMSQDYRVTSSGTVYRFRVPATAKQINAVRELRGQHVFDEAEAMYGRDRTGDVIRDVYHRYNLYEIITEDNFHQYLRGRVQPPYIKPMKPYIIGAKTPAIIVAATCGAVRYRLTLGRLIYCSFVGISEENAKYEIRYIDGDCYNVQLNNIELSSKPAVHSRAPRRRLIDTSWMDYL